MPSDVSGQSCFSCLAGPRSHSVVSSLSLQAEKELYLLQVTSRPMGTIRSPSTLQQPGAIVSFSAQPCVPRLSTTAVTSAYISRFALPSAGPSAPTEEEPVVFGCTMNPVSSETLNIGHVLSVTHAAFVVYVRTNVVKRAVASVRGALYKEVGKTHVVARRRGAAKGSRRSLDAFGHVAPVSRLASLRALQRRDGSGVESS